MIQKVLNERILAMAKYTDISSVKKIVKLTHFSTYFALATLGVSALLTVLFSSYFPLFLLVTIPLIYLGPVLYLNYKKYEHINKINSEFPFFLILAMINENIGKNIVDTFKEISSVSLFPALSKEWQYIQKRMSLTGELLGTVLMKIGGEIGGEVGNFFYRYGLLKTQGITRELVNEMSKESLSNLSQRFADYLSHLEELIEIAFMIYLLLPLTIIAFSITFSINYFILMLPLLFVPAILMYVDQLSPLRMYNVPLKKRDFLPFMSTIVFLPFIHLTLDVKILILSLTLELWFTNYYLVIRKADKMQSELPLLIENTINYFRTGKSIKYSLIKLGERKLSLSRIIREIKNGIFKGGQIPVVNSPSTIVNYVISIMRILDERGGRNEISLIRLSEFVQSLNMSTKVFLKKINLYEALSIISPLILVYAFSIMKSIGTTNDAYLLKPFIMIYSISLSVIFTKASRFTIFYTPIIILTTVVSYLALHFI